MDNLLQRRQKGGLKIAAMVLIPSESTARAMFDAYWIETIVITTKDAQNRDVEKIIKHSG